MALQQQEPFLDEFGTTVLDIEPRPLLQGLMCSSKILFLQTFYICNNIYY